ncbi:hypothetical protein ACFQ60_03330 [Streptomyces zhihengii]
MARLHALNHGSITTRIAGTEVGRLEQKVKEWAATFPEIKVAGTGPGAVVRLELTGVDLDAVLANAQVHNNLGNRRAKMRSLLKDALGVGDGPGGFDAYDVLDLVWKGTERQIEVVFGHVADVDSLSEATLRPSQDDAWRLVVDFPYDEGEFGPMDDLQRLRALREKPGGDSRTLAWLPTHLTDASRSDFERLVVIDKALADEARFDSNSHAASTLTTRRAPRACCSRSATSSPSASPRRCGRRTGSRKSRKGSSTSASTPTWSPSRMCPSFGFRSVHRWTPPPATWPASCLPTSTPPIPTWTQTALASL